MAEKQHTKECKKQQKLARKQVMAYDKRFPNHCKTCDGWGYLPDDSSCLECLAKDRCPRCGQPFPKGLNKCPHCSFDLNNDRGRPDDSIECNCYINEEEDWD